MPLLRGLDQRKGLKMDQGKRKITPSYTYDLSASGGPHCISAEALTEQAARAKTKVKSAARGWSQLSQIELLALAWFADLWLEDAALAAPAPAKPAPQLISET